MVITYILSSWRKMYQDLNSTIPARTAQAFASHSPVRNKVGALTMPPQRVH